MAYNISAFAGAGAQFFDNSGEPLVGGLIYTYAAGTTTPATTYTTQSGLTANTNPIVLDAAGRTPNEIWVAGGLLYKFILKTSTNVTIGTYDNIPGIDDPTVFNDLITVTGTNTLLGTAVPPVTGYVTGATYSFVVQNNNTGPVTVSIDGLGAKEITYAGSTPLVANQLVANAIVVIEYDGTRFQLMQSSASVATVAALTVAGNNISAVNSLGFRNRIINGNMVIDQRNAGASVAVATTVFGYLTVDRWRVSNQTDGALTLQQSSVAPAGFNSSLLATITTADASLGAAQFCFLQQAIEGFNVGDLAFGSASASPITLSFWVRSSLTGTFGGAITNGAINRSYPFTYTISAANTWEQKTVTLSGDTTGTWATNNTAGINVFFSLGTGTDNSATAGAWVGAQEFSATGAVSVVGTNGATFYITGVQLEAGSVATPFERRDYGRELIMCQRYYENINMPNTYIASVLTTALFTALYYKVTKRTNPSATATGITYYSAGSGGVAVPTVAFGSIFQDRAVLLATGLTNGNGFDGNGFVLASAEL
jgi:hypothetical protein